MRHLMFHLINSSVSSIFSIIGNLSLLHLSLRDKSLVLRGYRRMFVTMCIQDLIFTVFVFLGQHQVEFVDGYALAFLFPPIRRLDLGLIFFICFMRLTFIGLASTSVLLVFYFRYQMLCRNHIMTSTQITQFMSIAFVWAALDGLLMLYGIMETRDHTTSIIGLFARHSEWWEDGKPIEALVVHKDALGYQIFMILGAILVFGSYIGAVYFGYLVYSYFSKNQHRMSPKTRRLHRNMERAMIVQGLIPFINCTLPVGITYVTLLTKSKSSLPWIIFSAFTIWISALNPIVTIGLIGPFRREIKENLVELKKRLSYMAY